MKAGNEKERLSAQLRAQEGQGGLWEEAEIVFAYTDADAVDDGVLVELGAQDRVTRPVFELCRNALPFGQPPSQWPVQLVEYIAGAALARTARQLPAGDERKVEMLTEALDMLAFAALRGLLGSWKRQALERKPPADFLTLWVVMGRTMRGPIYGISREAPDDGEGLRLWFVPNELGGVTVMFPEDY